MIISFDIFNTLVLRNVASPSDVFEIVEKKYNSFSKDKINDFKNSRRQAEIAAIKKTVEDEITIDDIYYELETFYSKKQCTKLRDLEVQTEINICVPNRDMKIFFDKCLKNNCDIVITSDMYLDKNTIEKILHKCGFNGYKELFLSSEIKLTKRHGGIFNYIKKTLGTKKILHIGDNIISDVIMPRIYGIKSTHYTRKNSSHFTDKLNLKHKDYVRLNNFICNTSNNRSYYYQFGYSVFGPILYGFTKWLIQNTNEKERIFFLARDGYIVRKAYELFSNNNNHQYMYASRRSVVVPALWKEASLLDAIDKYNFDIHPKISKVFDRFGLEKEDYFPIFDKYNVPYSYANDKSKLKYDKKFISIINDLDNKIRRNSKKEYKLFLEYLTQIQFEQTNAVLVDIGWNGSMQKAINHLISDDDSKNNIRGYYVGYYNDNKTNLNAYGFLVDKDKNTCKYAIIAVNAIFESLFLAPHGSVKNFKREGDKIVPICYEYEYSNKKDLEIFQTIQNAALDFCKNLNDSDLANILNIGSNIARINLQHFAFHPTMTDVKMFGDLDFFDYDTIKMAKPRSFSYYIFHPKNFMNDLYRSGWKIGFLKRLTHVNLLYDKLFILVAKIFKY